MEEGLELRSADRQTQETVGDVIGLGCGESVQLGQTGGGPIFSQLLIQCAEMQREQQEKRRIDVPP